MYFLIPWIRHGVDSPWDLVGTSRELRLKFNGLKKFAYFFVVIQGSGVRVWIAPHRVLK